MRPHLLVTELKAPNHLQSTHNDDLLVPWQRDLHLCFWCSGGGGCLKGRVSVNTVASENIQMHSYVLPYFFLAGLLQCNAMQSDFGEVGVHSSTGEEMPCITWPVQGLLRMFPCCYNQTSQRVPLTPENDQHAKLTNVHVDEEI